MKWQEAEHWRSEFIDDRPSEANWDSGCVGTLPLGCLIPLLIFLAGIHVWVNGYNPLSASFSMGADTPGKFRTMVIRSLDTKNLEFVGGPGNEILYLPDVVARSLSPSEDAVIAYVPGSGRDAFMTETSGEVTVLVSDDTIRLTYNGNITFAAPHVELEYVVFLGDGNDWSFDIRTLECNNCKVVGIKQLVAEVTRSQESSKVYTIDQLPPLSPMHRVSVNILKKVDLRG